MKFESLLSGQEVGGPPAAVEERGANCCPTPEARIPELFPFYSRGWQVETFRGSGWCSNPTDSLEM